MRATFDVTSNFVAAKISGQRLAGYLCDRPLDDVVADGY